ncbi:hypothetical protein [Streptomyces niveus]
MEATARVLNGRLRRPPGTAAPGDLFDAADFLRSLAPAHLAFTEDAG